MVVAISFALYRGGFATITAFFSPVVLNPSHQGKTSETIPIQFYMVERNLIRIGTPLNSEYNVYNPSKILEYHIKLHGDGFRMSA